MAKIKLATGLKTYDIEDENGYIRGSISINPKDFNFPVRAMKMIDRIKNWENELASKKEDDISDEDVIKLLNKYDELIKTEINELFDDENTSNVVFGNQNVFNLLRGTTFIERFLEAIMPVILAEYDKEIKASNKRINDYVEDAGIEEEKKEADE